MPTTTEERGARWLGLERGDGRLVAGLASIHALLFFAAYMARPLRDEIAANIRGEINHLWQATFVVMLVIAPLFAWFVRSRTPRRVLAHTLWIFGASALLFAALLGGLSFNGRGLIGATGEERLWLERVFYVWSAVFALLPVSAFWSFATGLCPLARAKRIFGWLAAAATIGHILGSHTVGAMSSRGIDVGHILVVVAGVLALAGVATILVDRAFARAAARDEPGRAPEAAIGGTIWSGFSAVVRSPALLGICVYVLFYTLSSTVYYYVQSNLVGSLFEVRDERRTYLAGIDATVGWVTLALQAGLSGPIMRRFGLGATLCGLPLISILGAIVVWSQIHGGLPIGDAVAGAHVLGVLGAVLVVQRVARYALAKPAREALFTLVSRDARFKSKNFIDTAVYRGGDVLAAELWTVFAEAGFTTATLTLSATPIMALWALQSWRLGRAAREKSAPPDST